MKALLATSILFTFAGSQATLARPYAVVENNGGFTGSNFTGSVTDIHVGWEEQGFYAEFGPSIFSPDGGETEVLMTAKAGALSVSQISSPSTANLVSLLMKLTVIPPRLE